MKTTSEACDGCYDRMGRARRRLWNAFGDAKSVKDWAADPRGSVSQTEFRRRVKGGVPPEDAIKTRDPDAGHTTYTALDESKILSEWARDRR
ncbi:MAG: hypothetical protein P4L46_18580 [Fimbriimonas sp.]|nr:hypothetical protein [Fimbriimonas sp.]